MKTKIVADFSTKFHGIMLPGYFQGQGTAFTGYDDVATGIGETAREAFEDALDQLAQFGWDVAAVTPPDNIDKAKTVTDYLKEIGVEQDDDAGEFSYWHVSVLVK